ncbi:DgyrCDS5952 [Dimorphilus gyrociliatus]|uniref:DgyrCDS5952 n=1 Tax=Dimorphilus gyrociliatus TaxID=2664684 RepID=A0A7I8VN42_9ANNE|nr:DgyrCDS5952 [Dimorphilus gyrociliatus]
MGRQILLLLSQKLQSITSYGEVSSTVTQNPPTTESYESSSNTVVTPELGDTTSWNEKTTESVTTAESKVATKLTSTGVIKSTTKLNLTTQPPSTSQISSRSTAQLNLTTAKVPTAQLNSTANWTITTQSTAKSNLTTAKRPTTQLNSTTTSESISKLNSTTQSPSTSQISNLSTAQPGIISTRNVDTTTLGKTTASGQDKSDKGTEAGPNIQHILIGTITTICILTTPTEKIRTSRPILARDFVNHVYEFSRDSNLKFFEDYGNFKLAKENAKSFIKAAELPVNRPKNRFTNVLAYDDTRVRLSSVDGEEGSDYINANYVPGYSMRREYIATQGPLPGTTDDFWRMIWEQKCRVIVMMTKFKEKNVEKCYNYMPQDDEPVARGDLEIVVLPNGISQEDNYIVTRLRLSLGCQERIITHFNYLDWLDKTAPSNYDKVIKFVTIVREEASRFFVGRDQSGPVCVHCSAGVGRTGSFIVLDRCLQQLRDNPKLNITIDIYGMVWEMRQYRCLLVQTDDQYALVHNCVAYAIETGYHKHLSTGDQNNSVFINGSFTMNGDF